MTFQIFKSRLFAIAFCLMACVSTNAQESSQMQALIGKSLSKLQAATPEAFLNCIAEMKRIDAMFPDSIQPKYQTVLQSLNFSVMNPNAEQTENLLAEAGQTIEKMEQMKKYIEYYMVLPSTKYFYQSGFMYRVGSIASDLFHIHPVLKMSRGHMKIVTAYVGDNSKARRHFLRRQLHNRRKINQDVVMFTHIGCSAKQLSAMRTELTRYIPFENVIMQKGSFSLGCNCGVGAIGVAYLRKTKDDSKEESYWN